MARSGLGQATPGLGLGLALGLGQVWPVQAYARPGLGLGLRQAKPGQA